MDEQLPADPARTAMDRSSSREGALFGIGAVFEENRLSFLYQDHLEDGLGVSRFNKLVRRGD